jgi:3-oxoacyl-[acyl-carrier protein] reductase
MNSNGSFAEMGRGLNGRVAVVTGAAQGIGEVYARHLGSLGAAVVLADIDADGVTRTAAKLAADGISAWAHHLDVSNEESVQRLAEAVLERHPESHGADILVNNAAIYRGLRHMQVETMDVDYWRRVIDVNVTGVMIVTRAFIPQLKQSAAGKVVNAASASAHLMVPGVLHYCVSKAAVIALTQGLARELGPFGIRVNAIAPGVTLTTATREAFDEEAQKAAAQQTSLRANATADDMRGPLEFLVSDASNWVTGQTVVADGGKVMIG